MVPLQGIAKAVPEFEAWRWAFFVPGGLYLIAGISTLLFGQDAPDGDYRDLKKNGQMAKKVRYTHTHSHISLQARRYTYMTWQQHWQQGTPAGTLQCVAGWSWPDEV